MARPAHWPAASTSRSLLLHLPWRALWQRALRVPVPLLIMLPPPALHLVRVGRRLPLQLVQRSADAVRDIPPHHALVLPRLVAPAHARRRQRAAQGRSRCRQRDGSPPQRDHQPCAKQRLAMQGQPRCIPRVAAPAHLHVRSDRSTGCPTTTLTSLPARGTRLCLGITPPMPLW